MRVGRYIMISPTHHYSAWHRESLCGVSRNQLTSTVNGQNRGSRLRWSMHTSWTTSQSDNWALLSLENSGLSWTVFTPDKVTAVPVRRNGNFQTLISVPAVRPKRCHTLSNPAYRQDYTVACLNYTLQTMMLLPGWPVMAPKCIRQQQLYATDNWHDCTSYSTTADLRHHFLYNDPSPSSFCESVTFVFARHNFRTTSSSAIAERPHCRVG